MTVCAIALPYGLSGPMGRPCVVGYHHAGSYAPLVTHRFGLGEVDLAFELMDTRGDDLVKGELIPRSE